MTKRLLLMDKRTRAGREAEVIAQVEQHGGFTVFWACESSKRAHAIDRLQKSGAIVRIDAMDFPWARYRTWEHTTFTHVHVPSPDHGSNAATEDKYFYY